MIVFADTSYWIALLDPRDSLHMKVRDLSSAKSFRRIVTSQMVLVELLAAFSHVPHLRSVAARICDELQANQLVEVVPQSPGLFAIALSLYRKRIDKTWSMTDCASFQIMRDHRIKVALTYDHHFEQAGFRALMRDEKP